MWIDIIKKKVLPLKNNEMFTQQVQCQFGQNEKQRSLQKFNSFKESLYARS